MLIKYVTFFSFTTNLLVPGVQSTGILSLVLYMYYYRDDGYFTAINLVTRRYASYVTRNKKRIEPGQNGANRKCAGRLNRKASEGASKGIVYS